MDGWSHRGLIAVALVCMGVSIADAQVKTSRPTDHPGVTIIRGRPTPPADSSPAKPIVSGQRFDRRADLGRVPGPLQAGGGLTSEGVIPWWPWAGLWPTPMAAIPVDLVPPSNSSDGRGGVQLDVQPWRALVYVDGVYAGVVGDFTGYYRPLELDAGLHVITIVAPPDYDPVTLAVVVPSGDVVTYRGTLSLTAGR